MKQEIQKKNRFFFVLIYLLTFIFFSTSLFAQNNLIEYKIKAGYLYNFTKFIYWPENDLDTFNICILGDDPFGKIIDPIEKRTVKTKPIKLYRLRTIKEVNHCHILYFNDSEISKHSKLVSSGVLTISTHQGALTVGESLASSMKGGMIYFFLKDGKIKLHINLQRLRSSNLEVSAKLLEIAEIYEGETDE